VPMRFNPRPRVEGDAVCTAGAAPFDYVSIRALAWRAIAALDISVAKADVSIRALAWRAIYHATEACGHQSCFNPRPRVEGDVANLPTWCASVGFNPRPRVEGDGALSWMTGRGCYVSIRALAWRAMKERSMQAVVWSVSIRALAWRAIKDRIHAYYHSVFQSAPSRGGRSATEIAAALNSKFQSAPSRGGRWPGGRGNSRPFVVSIRALAWRAITKRPLK